MKIKQLCILNSARNPLFFFEKKKYIYNILQLKLPGQIIINVDVAVAFFVVVVFIYIEKLQFIIISNFCVLY